MARRERLERWAELMAQQPEFRLWAIDGTDEVFGLSELDALRSRVFSRFRKRL